MRAMAAFFLRLIALLAIMLMPLGMSAPAAAQATPHAMSDQASHCGSEEGPAHAVPMKSDCLACAGLPAAEAPAATEQLLPRMPLRLALAHEFLGIEPEIATPPPRA